MTAQEGLQAWKILQDQTNHIDLVLTEVVMPGLSGIGLLSKIMSHKTCKTVPVISEHLFFLKHIYLQKKCFCPILSKYLLDYMDTLTPTSNQFSCSDVIK